MKNLVETIHTDLTIGELCRTIEEKNRPVKRSPHIGNIRSRDLAVMTALPAGVEVIMVNTIQGDDKVTKPHVVRLGPEKEVSLSSRNAARNRVVGAVAITLMNEAMHDLPVPPRNGQNIAEYHLEALNRLPLRNPPVNMMEHFNSHPDLLRATAEACLEQGSLHRQVGHGGKISANIRPNLEQSGLYGIDDTSPANIGALLPLSGMMTLDMLMSEESGSNETLHLGGGDMVRYTRDMVQMEEVGSIMAKVAALMGRTATRHRYIVQDCRGLAAAVPGVSQHELLLNAQTVDLSAHFNQPAGGNDDK